MTIKLNATVLLAMLEVSKTKLENCKNIIIETNDLQYKILTESYQGDIVLAAWATNPVQPKATGAG